MMGIFDNRSDNEKEIDEFYKNRKKQSEQDNNDTYNINQSTENNSVNNKKQPRFKIEFGTVDTEKKETDNQHDVNIEYEYQEEYSKAYEEISKNNSKERKIGYIIFLVIAVILVANIFLMSIFSGDSDSIEIFTNVMIFFMLSVFAVIGFGIAFIPRMKTKKNKERCKQLVKAKIIDVKKEYCGSVKTEYGSRSRYRYISTYQYFYSGIEYVAVTDTYQGLLIPKVGDEIDMFVNENEPEDYYIERKDADLLALVFGLIFAIAPTLLFGLNLLLLKI